MSKKQQQIKKPTLFDPGKIATAIHQAIKRDFASAQQMYALNDTSTLYAFNRQVNELLKKFVPPDDTREASLESATYEKFLKVNDHMAGVNEKLINYFPDHAARPGPSHTERENIHIRARALMHMVLSGFEYDEWFTECKNSAGSTLGVSYQDTSQERKFTFPMTVTKEAKPFLIGALDCDLELQAAVFNYNRYTPIGEVFEEVEGSRATTVPKSTEINRFIAIEPTGNMYLQQGLMAMMYKRMSTVGLDVSSLPEKHKELARESSISCKNATIDWSSASDCSSPELLKWLLPRQWYMACETVRCRSTQINGETSTLNMFSSMGNATTFPIETLVFWTYAHAVRLTKLVSRQSVRCLPEWEDLAAVSVFGDDCIVPSELASDYIDVITEVGYMVNDEKSYYGAEQFRESCGGDYLAGYDVRPFNLKAPHSTRKSALEAWLYIIANRLLKKYISYFGTTSYVYDKHLWRVLFALFRRNGFEVKLVPSFFPDDSGLKLSYDILRFQRHYRIKLSTIAVSNHGSVTFKALRFQYRKRLTRHDGIRMALWLKNPRFEDHTISSQKFWQPKAVPSHHLIRPNRKVGGYVVAKGLTCHWHVPTVR